MAELAWLEMLGETLFTIPGWSGGTVVDLEKYLYSQGMTSEKTYPDGIKSYPNWLYRTDDNGLLNLNTTFYDEYGNELSADEVNERIKNGNTQIYLSPTQGKIRVAAEKKIKGMLSAFGLKVKDGAEWILDNLIENMGYDKARGTWLDITRTGDKAVTTANKKEFEKLKDLLKKNHLLGEDTGTSFVSGNWSLPAEFHHVAVYQNNVARNMVKVILDEILQAGKIPSSEIESKILESIMEAEGLQEVQLSDDDKAHLGIFGICYSDGDICVTYGFNYLDYDYNIIWADNTYFSEGYILAPQREFRTHYQGPSCSRKMFQVDYYPVKGTIIVQGGSGYKYCFETDRPYRNQGFRLGGAWRDREDPIEVGSPVQDKNGKITDKIKRYNGDIVPYTDFSGIVIMSRIGNDIRFFQAEDILPCFFNLTTSDVGIQLDPDYPKSYENAYPEIIGLSPIEAVNHISSLDSNNYNTMVPRFGFFYGVHVDGIDNGININLEKTDDKAAVVDPDKSLEEQYQGWTESGQAVVETYPRDDVLTQDKSIALPFPIAEDATQAVAQAGTKVWDYAKAQADAAGAVAVDRATTIDAATVIDGVLVDPTIQPVIPGGKVEITTPTGTGAGGLWAIYNPTVSQIQSFGKWLWEDPIEGLTQPGDTLKKLFQNPMDAIISLHKIYVTPTTGAAQNIKVGYLDSGVSSKTVTNRYVTKDLGSVTISPLNGNFMDFDGVELTIFLPFIGMRSLDTSVCMGATLSLSYRIDILTGAIVASLTVNKNNISGVVYQWVGNMLESVPLTSSNFSQAVNAVIGLVGSAVTTIATGGATAPMIAGAGINALGSAGTSIQNCGSIGGNAGALASKTPYIVYSIVQTYNPYNWRHIKGLPDNVTQTVGSQSGYIEADEITGVTTMTDEEFNDCKNIFSDGIFIN